MKEESDEARRQQREIVERFDRMFPSWEHDEKDEHLECAAEVDRLHDVIAKVARQRIALHAALHRITVIVHEAHHEGALEDCPRVTCQMAREAQEVEG